MPYHFSDPVKDLISRMLKPDPIARITINQIKKHPWFQINNETKFYNRITSKSYEVIDEEIMTKCLRFPLAQNLSIDQLREKIINRKSDPLVVCYELLDKKLNDIRGKDRLVVHNLSPIFMQKPIEFSSVEISTRASSSQGENSETAIKEDGIPDNWVYGFRTDLETYPFMMTLFASLKESNLE